MQVILSLSNVVSKYLFTLFVFFSPYLICYSGNVTYQPIFTDANFSRSYSSSTVGLTDGNHAITQLGAASYSIPIRLAPGINGIEPNLSITYNSQSSSGLLGMGWNISGLSAIALDVKKYYYDNIAAPVTTSPSDPSEVAFTLDGMRLMPVNGVNGGLNVTYSTESEAYSTIISSGVTSLNCILCPLDFTVKTKNGLIFEYGKTTDSKIFASNNINPYEWRINKKTDNNGNYIEYKYDKSDGESKISEINYTGNSIQGTLPFNKIKFYYIERTDQNSTYISTGINPTMLTSKNLLDKIEIYTDGQIIRKYQFNYAYDGLYSVLQEVKESGFDNGNPVDLNSTIFRYGNPKDISSSEIQGSTTLTNIISNSNSDTYQADFNGDGYADIAAFYFEGNTNNGKIYYAYKIFQNTHNPNSFVEVAFGGLSVVDFTMNRFINIADFNGDGLPDICLDNYKNNNGTLERVYKNILFTSLDLTGNVVLTDNNSAKINIGVQYYDIAAPNNPVIVGDFNGDGKSDYINTYKKRIGSTIYASMGVFFNDAGSTTPIRIQYPAGTLDELGNQFGNNPVFCISDLDGDGKQEILFTNGKVLKLFKTGTDQYEFRSEQTYLNASYKLYTGDFNGDGKTDLLTYNSTTGWEVSYSTNGVVFAKKPFNFVAPYSILFNQNPSYNNSNILVADFNGDGKSDVLLQQYDDVVKKTYNSIYYSDGNNFKLNYYTVNNNDRFTIPVLGDFNGDASQDVLNQSWNPHASVGKPYLITSFGNQHKERLLRKILDGFNRKIEFEYLPLTSSTVYTYSIPTCSGWNPLNCNYPLKTICTPMYVVASIKKPDGIGGVDITSFLYNSLKMHTGGKGLLGFNFILDANSTTSIGTFTFYQAPSSANYFTMPVINLTKFTGSFEYGNIFYTKDLQHSYVDLGNKRYFQKLDKVTEEDKVSGIKTISDYSYDNNGNIITQIVDYPGIQTVTSTFGTFVANGTSTYPSLPTVVTKQILRGGTTYTKPVKLSYDSKGRISQTIEYDGEEYKLTTNYAYDNFGNKISTILKGKSGAGDITRTENTTYFSDGRFLNTQEVLNVKDYTYYTQYDNRFGRPTYFTNYNGKDASQIQYDILGRTKKITPVMPTGTSGLEVQTTYQWSTLYNSTYLETTTPQGMSSTKKYYDMFNRLVRQEDGTKFVEYQYNNKGDIVTQKNNDANGATIQITNTYDNFHRLLSSSPTIGSATTNIYTATTNGFIINSSKVGYPNKITKVDATNKIVEVTESGGGSSVTNNYTYHANGNLLSVYQGGKNLITNTYDQYGNKITAREIDARSDNTYTYDAFGKITKQIDSKNNTTELFYDAYGRLINKTIKDAANPSLPPNSTSFEYTPIYSDGSLQVKKITHFDGSTNSYITHEYGYDSYGNLIKETKNFEGIDYVTDYTYGNYNRKESVTYPSINSSRVKINYEYSTDGLMTKVISKNGTANNQTIFNTQADKYNAFNQVKNYNLGNGLSSTTSYNALGMPIKYLTQTLIIFSIVKIQDLNMSWDANNNNLLQRKDGATRQHMLTPTENFTYDAFNRLTSSKLAASTSVLEVGYNNIGNITKKYDAGSEYSYGDNPNDPTTLLHAVSYVKALENSPPTPNDVTEIRTDKQEITYNGFNQPSLIVEGVGTSLIKKLRYIYDIDGTRIKSIYTEENGAGVVNTAKTIQHYYIGNYEFEKDANNNIIRQINYIYTPVGLSAVLCKETGQSDSYFYTYTDHLGSITCVTAPNGVPIYDQSFDAWGRNRNPVNWTYSNVPQPLIQTNRGFCGHEMLYNFDLINMNGRLYDPKVGRMLSPDKFINDPFSTQTYNKYSYVWNNPLKYIDFDGWDGSPVGPIAPPPPPAPTYTLPTLLVTANGTSSVVWGSNFGNSNSASNSSIYDMGGFNTSAPFKNFLHDLFSPRNSTPEPYKGYTGSVYNKNGTTTFQLPPSFGKFSVLPTGEEFIAAIRADVDAVINNKYYDLTSLGLEESIIMSEGYLLSSIAKNSTVNYMLINQLGGPTYFTKVLGITVSTSKITTAASGLKIAGGALAGFGAAVSAYQYNTGQISGKEFTVDLVMTGVAFLGPVGAGVSFTYFAGKATYEYFSGDTLFDKPK